MKRSELADIAIKLYKNVDDAEQFSDYITGLIEHCDKTYLLYFIKCMADAVEFNLTTHTCFKDTIENQSKLQ